MKIKKYNELRTSKANEIKKSVEQSKVIEIQHYNEPVGYFLSVAQYKKLEFLAVENFGEDLKRAEKLKENS